MKEKSTSLVGFLNLENIKVKTYGPKCLKNRKFQSLGEFKVFIYRMYSIHLSKLRSTSTLFPTQNINLVCVQFETLAKNQNNECMKSILFQEATNLKESSRYDLPLGSKKMPFISRKKYKEEDV